MQLTIHHFYFLYYLLAFAFDTLSTRYVYKNINPDIYTNDEKYGFHYLFILSKLMLMKDISNYSSFFFSQNVYTINQIFVVKIFTIFIWIFLGLRLSFSYWIVAYIGLTVLYIVSLVFLYMNFSHHTYHNYNLKLSADLNTISAFMFSEIINGFKSITLTCVGLMVFYDFNVFGANIVNFIEACKGAVLLFDKMLEKNTKDKTSYYKKSTILIGCLALFNGIYVLHKTIKKGFLREPINIFKEILVITIFMLQMGYLYLLGTLEKN